MITCSALSNRDITYDSIKGGKWISGSMQWERLPKVCQLSDAVLPLLCDVPFALLESNLRYWNDGHDALASCWTRWTLITNWVSWCRIAIAELSPPPPLRRRPPRYTAPLPKVDGYLGRAHGRHFWWLPFRYITRKAPATTFVVYPVTCQFSSVPHHSGLQCNPPLQTIKTN